MKHFNPGSRTHARGEDAEESAISKTICNRYKQDKTINARRPAVVEQGGGILKSRVDIKQQSMVFRTRYAANMFLRTCYAAKQCIKKNGNPPVIPTLQRCLHFIANHIRQHRFECTLVITALFP
jgi:hypothetical protein